GNLAFMKENKISFQPITIRLLSAAAVTFQTNFYLQFFQVRFHRPFIVRTSKRRYLTEKFNYFLLNHIIELYWTKQGSALLNYPIFSSLVFHPPPSAGIFDSDVWDFPGMSFE